MTTAEILASLEAQIRKDIPRLTELSEGCVLLNKSNKDKFEIIDIDTDFYEYVCLKKQKSI
ncbi:hypothetical protein QIU18_00465 [Capnocytophaga canimorsus]|nr:hypothetical protein [Capnocytophaga canimorsus]WGU70664.1 hypothetical protein QIU18_00465 [Capnocytophaga canimorsus]